MPQQYAQEEPFLIHFILKPGPQTDLIYQLIQAYSFQLEDQHPEFMVQFREKQEKILRHKEKLKQINQMQQDQTLKDKILHEIQIKDYQKEYEQALYQNNNLLSGNMAGPKQNKTFHFTNRNKRNRQSQQNFTIYDEKSHRQNIGRQDRGRQDRGRQDRGRQDRGRQDRGRQEVEKKFRSSLIKKGSFSAIKRRNQDLNAQSKKDQTDNRFRNSQDWKMDCEKNDNFTSNFSKERTKQTKGNNTKVKSKKEPILNRKMFSKSKQNNQLYISKEKKSFNIHKNTIYQNVAQYETNQMQTKTNRQSKDHYLDEEDDTDLFESDQKTQIQQKIKKQTRNQVNSEQKMRIKLENSNGKDKRGTMNVNDRICKEKTSNYNAFSSGRGNCNSSKVQKSPYDIKNFMSQLNSYHYKSIYCSVKKQNKNQHLRRQNEHLGSENTQRNQKITNNNQSNGAN